MQSETCDSWRLQLRRQSGQDFVVSRMGLENFRGPVAGRLSGPVIAMGSKGNPTGVCEDPWQLSCVLSNSLKQLAGPNSGLKSNCQNMPPFITCWCFQKPFFYGSLYFSPSQSEGHRLIPVYWLCVLLSSQFFLFQVLLLSMGREELYLPSDFLSLAEKQLAFSVIVVLGEFRNIYCICILEWNFIQIKQMWVQL